MRTYLVELTLSDGSVQEIAFEANMDANAGAKQWAFAIAAEWEADSFTLNGHPICADSCGTCSRELDHDPSAPADQAWNVGDAA